MQNNQRDMYNTPPAPLSSMTPPPSSQQELGDNDTSNHSNSYGAATRLSPAIGSNRIKREPSITRPYTTPSEQDIFEASPSRLRELLNSSIAENQRLNTEVREARMYSAHWQLQHNLLTIETDNATKRMEVEYEMTRREVEVLTYQHTRQLRHDLSASAHAESQRYAAEMKEYCQHLTGENDVLARRLRKAKRLIEQRDDEIATVVEENEQLIRRIRENREHINHLRSPGGLLATTTPHMQTSIAFPTTPQQYRQTPKHTPGTGRSSNMQRRRDGSQEPFAALLLADRVLSQENGNSAPSTPITPRHTQHLKHSRAVHSLSSLPTTPIHRSTGALNPLLPSAQFVPQSAPPYRGYERQPAQPKRRKSRDSTISASDREADSNMDYTEGEHDDIPESQATQSATAMLRVDPRQSIEIIGTPVAEKSGLLQARIFGQVTKPGMDKRKREESVRDGMDGPKKARTEELIGLGIGNWNEDRR